MNCDYCKTKIAEWKCGHCYKRFYCGSKCQTKDFNFHINARHVGNRSFWRERKFRNLLTGKIDNITILVYDDLPANQQQPTYHFYRKPSMIFPEGVVSLEVSVSKDAFPEGENEEDDFLDREPTQWILSHKENGEIVYDEL
jgi:hypothetical protein